jgi:hypothetical protein
MKSIAGYLTFFVPLFALMTVLWVRLGNGRLYYCSDGGSPFDLITPFVHTYPGIHTGDHYLVSPWIVWTVWGVCISITLLAPALALQQLRRWRHTDLHQTRKA